MWTTFVPQKTEDEEEEKKKSQREPAGASRARARERERERERESGAAQDEQAGGRGREVTGERSIEQLDSRARGSHLLLCCVLYTAGYSPLGQRKRERDREREREREESHA